MSDGITDSRKKLSDEEMLKKDLAYLKDIHRIMGETIEQISNRIQYNKDKNGTT
jgi:hypothetical protein